MTIVHHLFDRFEAGEVNNLKVNASDEEIASMIEGNIVMQRADPLRFTIDYPLNKAANFISSGATWTRIRFHMEVRDAYRAVYRLPTVYGIWSHELADLYMEGAYQRPDGSWELVIGS